MKQESIKKKFNINKMTNEEVKKGALICNIAQKVPLFKDQEEANKIELVFLEGLGYPVVVEKDFYSIGAEVVYIQPDFCIGDIDIFQEYIRPDGDINKSKLGKVNGIPLRIRAKKFNLHTGDGNPVYSYGIILPKIEVEKRFMTVNNLFKELTHNSLHDIIPEGELLDNLLCITKYEESEEKSNSILGGGHSLPFPNGVYKTDETNIFSLINSVLFPIHLIGTVKVDGSSITIGVTPEYPDGFICSRNLRKPLVIRKVVGYRHIFKNPKLNFIESILDSFYKFIMGRKYDRKIYQEQENMDPFVVYGKPILEDLKYLCYDNLILRGELNGKGCKGSGNPKNPSAKLDTNIIFFGIDYMRNGVAIKMPHEDYINTLGDLFLTTLSTIQYNCCPVVFNKVFETKEQLFKCCEDYFKENFVEGIVVKTPDSSFSAKVMNLEYDSKK